MKNKGCSIQPIALICSSITTGTKLFIHIKQIQTYSYSYKQVETGSHMVDLFNKTSIKYVTTNPGWKFQQKGLSKNANVTAHVQNDRDDHALHGDHVSGSVHHLQKI